jgi:hypothetical protein
MKLLRNIFSLVLLAAFIMFSGAKTILPAENILKSKTATSQTENIEESDSSGSTAEEEEEDDEVNLENHSLNLCYQYSFYYLQENLFSLNKHFLPSGFTSKIFSPPEFI